MALGTVTEIERGVMGDLKYVILDVQPTAGANYTANGEPVTLANTFGFPNELFFASCENRVENADISEYFVDIANMKLVAIDAATGVEEAGNQNLSAHRIRIFALGR